VLLGDDSPAPVPLQPDGGVAVAAFLAILHLHDDAAEDHARIAVDANRDVVRRDRCDPLGRSPDVALLLGLGHELAARVGGDEIVGREAIEERHVAARRETRPLAVELAQLQLGGALLARLATRPGMSCRHGENREDHSRDPFH
jgi:hypothetical protein